MGWRDNLQPASFRGVRFEVTATDEQVSRDHVAYEYPHVDGADVKDLGRKARPLRLTAFLWGDRYEYQLQTLMAALDEPGTGELIHPIYGSVPSVIVTGYSIRHDAESPDSCTVELNFLENRTGAVLFASELPEMFGDALFDELDALIDELAAFFDAITAPLDTINSLIKQAQTIESTLINTLLTFADDVSYSAEQISNLAQEPAAFVKELSSVLEVHTANVAGNVPALAASSPTTTVGLAITTPEVATAPSVITNWHEVTIDMDELVALPTSLVNGDIPPAVPLPVGAEVSDVVDVTLTYAVLAVVELTSCATAILSDDAQTDLLTTDDIETLVDDVRERSQSVIVQLRRRYEPTRAQVTQTQAPVGIAWLGIIERLKSAALRLQEMGMLVLTRRPPLTIRRVQADSSLRLLAHQWYANHERAGELQRLNPQVRDPNLITAGMVLHAYAK
ncbi:DNA circularization protein [Aeromonas veronii]|uniref:DNA circularization protein n=1 Tax=Aeromonas veronii TaxID=654 RepID=UPI001117BCA3|nr:DNA circularization N-terminal domain-containing protein [Aeromonas veronii]TNI12697.1 multidrug DMT transporter permease [Aeromonas veronii]